MNKLYHCPIVLLALLCICGAAFGQATEPAAEAPARYEARVPQGFVRMELDGRDIMLDTEDESWLRDALQQAGPTTAPSTMPSDVLTRFQQNRDDLRQRIMRDLALSDPAPIDEYFNERLGPFLQRMDGYRPPIVYLLVTPDRLKQIIKEGWADPRFYYNRAADDVIYTSRVDLSLEADDDVVVPLMNNPALSAELRQQQVVNQMRAVEQQVLGSVAGETLALTTAGLVELVAANATPSVELKSDQEWLVVGVAGVLGAQYVSQLSGMDARRLIEDQTRPAPGNPIRTETIDLLRPMNLSDLRPEWVPAYLDAYRRRAMDAARVLLTQAGAEAVPKLLTAIRQSPPADGPALVKLIQDQTGVDLTNQLGPR